MCIHHQITDSKIYERKIDRIEGRNGFTIMVRDFITLFQWWKEHLDRRVIKETEDLTLYEPTKSNRHIWTLHSRVSGYISSQSVYHSPE